MKISQAILATTLLLTNGVVAFWRMECRFETGIGRLDPIMDPGEISAHVHTFLGGGGIDGFNANYETLQGEGSCTSCAVSQDHSAYWTPALYFIYDNSTAVLVEQVGGMLAYYLPLLPNITAFPAGFQMVAGNPYLRNFTGPFPDTDLSSWPTDSTNDQFFLQQRSIGFNCLNYAAAPEPSLYRHIMPSKEYMDANCLDGLRLELGFPSCSNGDLDSSDHQSHMAYPSLVKEGNCPDGYDVVHYPFLFYETIWATNAFAGDHGQFVLSYGDPVGTGYHGDFIMGWESQDLLRRALEECQDPSGEIELCPLFDIQDDTDSQNCKFQTPDILLNDECHGPRSGLPVGISIQYGPEEATTYPIAGRNGQPTTTIEPTAPPPLFSNRPTLTYSPADPASTQTAPGGIVVAIHSPADSTFEATSTTTSAPVADSSNVAADIVATTTVISDNEVVELVIEQVEVTVTYTVPAEHATLNAKRHLHRHAYNHNRL